MIYFLYAGVPELTLPKNMSVHADKKTIPEMRADTDHKRRVHPLDEGVRWYQGMGSG
jgi:hypothetical protein